MREFIKDQMKKRKKFIIYTYVGAVMALLNIILVWLFIDIFNIPTIIASGAVVGGLFLVKFMWYKKAGFTQ